MSKSLWPFLLLSLTACAPRVAEDGTNQTFRAGDLEITVSAPALVSRQELYPIKVTYTNKGKQAVEFSDPLDCTYIWGVEQVESGKVLEPRRNYACRTITAPLKVLKPSGSYAGEFSAIISGYPKGQYRITPQALQELRPAQQIGPNKWKQTEFAPQPQEIRFEIR